MGGIKPILDKLIDELNIASETQAPVEKDGKPIGHGWAIISFEKLSIDMFETKPMRACSWNPTPENAVIQNPVLLTSRTTTMDYASNGV